MVSFPLPHRHNNNSHHHHDKDDHAFFLLLIPAASFTSMASTNSPPKIKGQPPLSSGPYALRHEKAKTHNQDQDQEDDDDYSGDHAEDLAEQYDGTDVGGGGGGGGGGHQKGKQEKRTLHTGKGTRHKLELLEKVKRSSTPPSSRASPPPKG